ncbi:alpha/beta fold hydrolase [Acetobacteraceae bacterium H6797]|nr:alpha/beta fold hydrolase [Acetobacteraceae bacterium H6797]
MRLKVIESGDGPPVVLLHGLFGMARNLGVVQRAIAPRHRVLAMDLRNHGDSPHAPGMTYPEIAGDVAETMRELGVEQAAVIGHSMGGKTAMMLALTHPAMVSRLLVADIAPGRNPPSFDGYAKAMRAIPLEPELTRQQADEALLGAVEEASIRAFLLQNMRFGAEPGWRIGLDNIIAGMKDILDWPDMGRTYEGPTLFVAGEKSPYIRDEHRPAIKALFPHSRLVTLKGAGHWLHAENPEGFNKIVEAFLAA